MFGKYIRPVKIGLLVGVVGGVVTLYTMFYEDDERIDPLAGAQLYESSPREEAMITDDHKLAGVSDYYATIPEDAAAFDDQTEETSEENNLEDMDVA